MVNWRTRRRRKRSSKGVKTLASDSRNWCRCAVGERRFELEEAGVQFSAGFGGRSTSAPITPYISGLGLLFNSHIHNGNKAGALEVLDKLDRYIELRV